MDGPARALHEGAGGRPQDQHGGRRGGVRVPRRAREGPRDRRRGARQAPGVPAGGARRAPGGSRAGEGARGGSAAAAADAPRAGHHGEGRSGARADQDHGRGDGQGADAPGAPLRGGPLPRQARPQVRDRRRGGAPIFLQTRRPGGPRAGVHGGGQGRGQRRVRAHGLRPGHGRPGAGAARGVQQDG